MVELLWKNRTLAINPDHNFGYDQFFLCFYRQSFILQYPNACTGRFMVYIFGVSAPTTAAYDQITATNGCAGLG